MDAQEIKLNPRYIVDSSGKPLSVILSMAEFRELIELLRDYADVDDLEKAWAEGRNFPPIAEF